MYKSSLSAKRNLTTGELKIWRHAAAYAKANSYFSCFFFSFFHLWLLFAIILYTVAASKTQIGIGAIAVRDSWSPKPRATRKHPKGTCWFLQLDRFWKSASILGKKIFFFSTVKVEGFSFPQNNSFDAQFQNKFVFQYILHITIYYKLYDTR